LTHSPAYRTRDSQPAWSPDGKQIVFVSDRGRPGGIWVINVDGTGLRSVTNPNDVEGSWPSYSPDGRQIVLAERRCSETVGGSVCISGSHLLIVNGDGTGRHLLATDGLYDGHPSWGPRGILFESPARTPGLDPGIKMIQPDGTGLQVILKSVKGWRPMWAPDGNKFAFLVINNTRVIPARGGGIDEFNFLNGMVQPLVRIAGFWIPIDILPGVSSKTISLKDTERIRVAILPVPAHPSLLSPASTP
jgi:Tol biopolymer transport system component